jgi:phosphoribosylaminoimidazole-succinocarboxamide synthase
MQKLKQIYEGKAKILYETEDPNILIQYFKDSATAFNAKKKATLEKKGELNTTISTILFQLLEKNGIKTHFIKTISDREMIVKKVKIFPIEFVMRNYAAGSIVKKYNIEKGKKFKEPIFEMYLKADALDDPMISDSHAFGFDLINKDELSKIKNIFLKINEILSNFFIERNIKLIDFKIEFGRANNDILVADEISPDSMRLWDSQTDQVFDKDLFRFDLGDLQAGYTEVLKRIQQ